MSRIANSVNPGQTALSGFTEDSEIFVRTLYSRIALKDTLVM